MDKVLLIGRGGPSFFLVANKLIENKDFEFVICVEKGRSARVAKLRRLLRGSVGSKVRAFLVSIPLLFLFNGAQELAMFGIWKKPKQPPTQLSVDDVNDPQLAQFLSATTVDIVFNFGSNLYTARTLANIRQPIVNLHTGILPAYRNVHSDFWAYLNNDLSGMGVTAFFLEEGIDSGPQLLAKAVNAKISDRLWTIKLKNLDLVVACILEILSDSRLIAPVGSANTLLGSVPDTNKPGKMWPNPGPRDILKYVWLEIMRRREILKEEKSAFNPQ